MPSKADRLTKTNMMGSRQTTMGFITDRRRRGSFSQTLHEHIDEWETRPDTLSKQQKKIVGERRLIRHDNETETLKADIQKHDDAIAPLVSSGKEHLSSRILNVAKFTSESEFGKLAQGQPSCNRRHVERNQDITSEYDRRQD